MTKIKVIFLLTILSGCAALPPFPKVNQCGYSVKFNKFRCCDNDGKNCFNLKRDDASMEAAQCLSADDFKKVSEWVDTVKQIAEERCH